MKSYKAGQIVTIHGDRYRVTKVAPNARCSMCQRHNAAMPCTFVYNYNEEFPIPWSYTECMKKIPSDCYLKKLKSD